LKTISGAVLVLALGASAILGPHAIPSARAQEIEEQAALPAPAPGDTVMTAQATETVLEQPDSTLALTVSQLPGEPLRLRDAIGEALQGDTSIRLAKAELLAAKGAERRERGSFSPELYGQAQRIGDHQPSASFFSGADVLETKLTKAELGARVRLPLGTELSASVNTTRTTTNSQFATISPQYDSFGQLQLVQPLLKGFGPAAKGDRDAAENSRRSAQAGYADSRLAARAAVETTYWGLYAAELDFAVQSLVRDRASSFLDQVRLRAKAGLAGPQEEANAEVFLASQEQTVLDSEDNLDSLSDRLAVLMGRRPSKDERFHPVDRPSSQIPEIDVDELVNLVMAHSEQVAAAQQNLQAALARAKSAHWNSLPQLDLVGTLGGRGLAGTGRDITVDLGGGPPTTYSNNLDTGLGDSFDQVFHRDFPYWSLGMVFNLPIGGGSDAGESDRLQAEVTRAEQELESVRRALDENVRAEYRELERSNKRIGFAVRGVNASLEQVRIGTLQFKNGRTTAFELVRLAADLADAQRRYSGALIRLASAAATLRRLTAGAYPNPGPADDIMKEPTP
jgi:outer membrane protein TolC